MRELIINIERADCESELMMDIQKYEMYVKLWELYCEGGIAIENFKRAWFATSSVPRLETLEALAEVGPCLTLLGILGAWYQIDIG